MAVLKTADEIIGPALDLFYTRRPKSFEHINLRDGVYWHPWAAQRAQASRALQRLVDLVASNSLNATGQDLLDYVASEFTAVPQTGVSFAQGELVLSRPSDDSLPSGDIAQGYRFFRQANLTTEIPLQSAEYNTLAPVHFDVGQLVSTPVPIQAVSQGLAANHPIRSDTDIHGVVPGGDTLFDPNLTVLSFAAAGGAELPDDPYVRAFAKAFSKGQYGPTRDASTYGGLSSLGVRAALAYDDIPNTTERMLIADGSWASSGRLVGATQQYLSDNDLIGFGCKVSTASVRNKVISVTATVVLRDWAFASDTLEIDTAIRAAVLGYFNDRPDWNIFKNRGLRAAITIAHVNILKCSAVVVKDVAGNEVPEIAVADYTTEQFHYYLAQGAVGLTYSGPS